MTVFALIAAILTIAAVGFVVWPLLRPGAGVHPVAATLTALATPAAVLLVYLLVSNYDWRGAGAPTAAPPPQAGMAAGSIEDAVASLERKLQENPADEQGWILLGSSYLNLERPADAVKAYQRAVDLSQGRNMDARLGVAEATIVLDPGSLSGAAGEEIETILKAEPRNPRALWYGGMVSLNRGLPEVARQRWSALLELGPPDRVRQIVEAQLAQLAGNGAGGVPAAGPAPAAAPAATPPKAAPGNASIGVAVSLSAGLRGKASATAPLFVFVRDADNAGPPLAVIRRQAGDLPVRLAISDADVMLPGRSLASVQSATLVARIANGGDPIAKPGDLYGEARWQRGDGPGSPVAIVIDQIVGP